MRANSLLAAVLVAGIGALLSIVWAVATPIGAGPDEPAHIIKAGAVVRGQLIGTGIGGGRVVVPAHLVATQARTCFAFQADVTGDCADAVDHGSALAATGNTTAGLYNPLYYAVVGLPSLVLDGDAAIYGMRIASALFTWLFAGAAAFSLRALRGGPWIAIGGLAAATPAFVFLGGMVNPNALEVTATLAAFSAVLVLVTSTDPGQVRTHATIGAVSAAVAVNVRGLSPVWVLVALVVPLLLLDRERSRALFRRPAVDVMIAVIGLATALAVAWTLGTASLVAGLAPDAPTFPGVGSSPLRGLADVLLNTFTYGTQMVGTVGWLDTPAPGLVLFVWGGFIAGLLACVALLLRGRRLAVALSLIGAFLLLPAVIQASYVHDGGYIWQGRYALPLFACMMVGSAAMIGDRLGDRYSGVVRRAATLVTAAWSVAQLMTLATSMRRYAVGLDGSWIGLFAHPQWQPPGGTVTWLIVAAVILIAATALVVSSTRMSSRARGTSG